MYQEPIKILKKNIHSRSWQIVNKILNNLTLICNCLRSDPEK